MTENESQIETPPTYSCIYGDDDENIPLEILIRIPPQAFVADRPPSYEGRLPVYTARQLRLSRTSREHHRPLNDKNGRIFSCVICCIIVLLIIGVPTLAVVIVSSVDKNHNYNGSL